jgi:hypothetical protein
VAELVDAADSKSAVRKGVKVRFLSWAPVTNKKPLMAFHQGFFIGYTLRLDLPNQTEVKLTSPRQ